MARGDTPSPPAAASSAQRLAVQSVYDKVEPSVVDVTSALRYEAATAEGTGFVISAADGLIITNNHVIRGATAVTVTLTSNGRQFPARVVGADVPADVALLQLQLTPSARPRLRQAGVGDSSLLGIGAPVLAIGNQAGSGGSPTVAPGAITGTGQTIEANDAGAAFTETLHNMLATSAHIAPGDSGGPLANDRGQVIGLVTAAGAGSPGTGYAIPIDDALAAAWLIAAGRPAPGLTLGTHAFLGVMVPATADPSPRGRPSRGQPAGAAGASALASGCLATSSSATAGMAGQFAPVRYGALVYGVLCGTGAATAGLGPGDVIIRAAGRPVASPGGLRAIVSGCRPGTLVPVTWISPGDQIRTNLVALNAAPAA
jgi:S1-C subfamily serine protease